MARTPDEGRARTVPLSLRVTPSLKASIDKSRGPVRLSSWMRQAIDEKIERDR